MSSNFKDLFLAGFTKPREVTRAVISREYSSEILVLAGCLLTAISLITVKSYRLYANKLSEMVANDAPNLQIKLIELPLYADIGFACLGMIVSAWVIAAFSKMLASHVTFSNSLLVYIVYHTLLNLLFIAFMLTSIFAGPLAIVPAIALLIWAPWALAQYWSELIAPKRVFAAFGVSIMGHFVANMIVLTLAMALGFTGAEVIQDV